MRAQEAERHENGEKNGLRGVAAYDVITASELWRIILEFL